MTDKRQGRGTISTKSWVRKLRASKWLRSLRRRRNKRLAVAGLLLFVPIIVAAISVSKAFMPGKIDPAAYAPLLDTIAKGESRGNYNAYYAHANNTSLRFTDMSIAEVMKWQEEYVKQGSPSSAVGKYQIVRPTLAGLVKQLNIDTSLQFDEQMQDRMAIALLERRGSQAYAEKKLSREEFAANLAKEWAALPKVQGPNPEESYYAGDGLNKSLISIDEVFSALGPLEL
jgi:muramidase (phage lysozyme)